MRKIIIISILIVIILLILLILGRLTLFNDKAIISRKVISIGELLSAQKIDGLDKYLSDSKFINNGKKIDYIDAKNNLKNALAKNEIRIGKKALYCTSIEVNSDAAVSDIIGWIIREKESSPEMDTEIDIEAKFKRTGFLGWKIIELKSDDDAFKYLFFNGNSK